MPIWPHASCKSRRSKRHRHGAWPLLLALVLLLLAACTQPGSEPTPAPGEQAAAPVTLPERCRGDGAVQTWLLLPLDPPQSELLTAYQDRQVIEFQATVIGQDDAPALQPHRRFILREAAEGITLLLDYQGDPPLLIQGQSYRFIAWADLVAAPDELATATPSTDPRESIPAKPRLRGADLRQRRAALPGPHRRGRAGRPAGLTDQRRGRGNARLRQRRRTPACRAGRCCRSRYAGDDAELTLYPGEDDLLAYQDGTYAVTLFRNRQVVYAEPPCADYHEHQRSLRIDRVDPLPVLPTLPPITGTLTTTLPITSTAPSAPAPRRPDARDA